MKSSKKRELIKNKKNRIIIYLFYLALPFFLLFLFKALNAEPRFVEDDVVSTEITLPSIVCEKCVKTIDNAFKNEEGVISININIEIRKAVVSFHHLKTSISKLEKAINKAGYDVNDKKADVIAYNKLPDCCKK